MESTLRIAIAIQDVGDAQGVRAALQAHPRLAVVATCHDTDRIPSVVRHQRLDALVVENGLLSTREAGWLQWLLDAQGVALIRLRGRSGAGQVSGGVNRITNARGLAARIIAQVEVTARDTIGQKTALAWPATADHAARQRLILIGASTGGIDALMAILKEFPGNCPPTAIVQHTGANSHVNLVRVLDNSTAAKVVAAEDCTALQNGVIAVAAMPGHHLRISRTGGRLLTRLQKVTRIPEPADHVPSVDRLFSSAIPIAPDTVGVILTGMGCDGATGLLELRQAGAHTIGQDQATSVVYGMPQQAKARGAVAEELPLEKIAAAALDAADYSDCRKQSA